MIDLIENANEKLDELLELNNVRAYYYGVCECYTKGYLNYFSAGMQVLITKLGNCIAQIDLNGAMISQCVESINYLGNKVLDENINALFKFNEQGNISKHKIKEQKNLLDYAKYFNKLIKKLVKQYNLTCLNKLIIKKDLSITTFITLGPKVSENASFNQINNYTRVLDDKVGININLSKIEDITPNNPNDIDKIKLNLKMNIQNPLDLDILFIHASFKCSNNIVEKDLNYKAKNNIIELDAQNFSGRIYINIQLQYKLSYVQTKDLEAKVAIDTNSNT